MAFDFLAETSAGVVRFVFSCITEGVVEFLCRKTGYLICRIFNKNVSYEGVFVVVVGLFFWIGLIIAILLSYKYIATSIAVDQCLDSGGAFDYQLELCRD